MIVSAIADPSIFGPASVTDELTSRELVGFLRGIVQNGLLLCDPSRQMVRNAMLEADTLSKTAGGTQRGQRISVLLQEIYKQHKKYIVCCEQAKWDATALATVEDQILVLHAHLQADIIVAPLGRHNALAKGVARPVEVVEPHNISISHYEHLRVRVACPDRPLDQMGLGEVEEQIGRAVKYCSVLRLFDYRMVARVRSTRKFCEGILFVLTIWIRWCVAGDPSSRAVELYTVGNTQTQDGFLAGADAKARLANEIIGPLVAACGCHSIGHVMDDSRGIFHARGFEAKKRAFTIDPGFDAIGSVGPVRRCLLKADVAAEKHFEECRSLRSV
jgi:hypothetical protein